MGRIVIYPYKIASASSKQLAGALRQHGRKILRVYPDRSFVTRPDDTIINWGSTEVPTWTSDGMLNSTESVSRAVNKLTTFQVLAEAGVRTVPFTADQNEASGWSLVCERHKLKGHGGDGVRVCSGDEVWAAPLYTKMLVPCEEYRVHVFNGEIIDYSKKYKRVNGEIIFTNDEFVKNRSSGWEFLREVGRREGVCMRAVQAVVALGLNFGSVDIIRHESKSYVLEVNTATGLSPKGLELYANKILEYAATR